MKAEKLSEMKDDLHFAGEKYLRENGWEYKCDHPDCCWRWQKEIKGRLYVMNYSSALDLQMYMEENKQ